MNPHNLFILTFIPYQPDIKTKTFTQTTDTASTKKRTNTDNGSDMASTFLGAPIAKKEA
jgi:hypothetical protein